MPVPLKTEMAFITEKPSPKTFANTAYMIVPIAGASGRPTFLPFPFRISFPSFPPRRNPSLNCGKLADLIVKLFDDK